jgi:dihydroneopterin aldolase
MLTTIQIAGLQTFGYHGLFEEERSLGQKFSFDIDATLNPAPTHRDDRLDASIPCANASRLSRAMLWWTPR